LAEQANMNELVRLHLVRAQEHMKKQADKRNTDHAFVIGDMVYMKLRPHVQSSVMSRDNQKLSFKYF
jgi:hypothetical protein